MTVTRMSRTWYKMYILLHLKKNTIYIFHDLNFGKLRGTRMVGNVVFCEGKGGSKQKCRNNNNTPCQIRADFYSIFNKVQKCQRFVIYKLFWSSTFFKQINDIELFILKWVLIH